MPNRTTKWTIEEEEILKTRRDQQIKEGYVNWEQIAQELNSLFQNNTKTSKQCRQKYINSFKFGEKKDMKVGWTPEELALFKQCYEQHGPAWSMMSFKFQRSENSLKNMFNNSIRKAAKVLSIQETSELKKFRRCISFDILIAILDFTNQLKKIMAKEGLPINQASNLFLLRTKILKYSFQNHEISNEQVDEFTKIIRMTNIRLRCYGVFKAKNRKLWKISEQNLKTVLQFDQVIAPEYFIKKEFGADLMLQKNFDQQQMVKKQQQAFQAYPPFCFYLQEPQLYGYDPALIKNEKIEDQRYYYETENFFRYPEA